MFNQIRQQLSKLRHSNRHNMNLLSSFFAINTADKCHRNLHSLNLGQKIEPEKLSLLRAANIRLASRSFKTIMAGEALSNNSSNQLEEFFESTYQQILKDTSTNQSSLEKLNEVENWLHKVIEYNLKNGKRNRAKSLVLGFDQFSPNSSIESIQAACILGWCVELLQAYFLVVDDIMDNSITRRGQLCWFRKESVGLTAINDGIMLNNCIYQLLDKYFRSHSSYLQIVDMFNEVTRFTAYGQCLDLISNPLNKKPELDKYTDDRYDAIVRYKTSYYSFCLPIRLAMYLANINGKQTHLKAEEILLKIGHLFQVQDDYLDCFGDPKITGKIGTDIEDGKCSWPIVSALKLVNETQRSVITQHYGSQSEESVFQIKSIYNELDIDGLFKRFEKEQFNEICSLIEAIDDKLLSKEVFYSLLTMIYQRKK